MHKRRFPLMNIALLTVVIIVLVIVNSNRGIPDERNCSFIIDDQRITLVDGRSDLEITEGSASRQVTDFIINYGGFDLNGDSRKDSIVFLRQRSGGSGTFYYIAAALGTGDGYRGSEAVFIGDRVEPLDIDYDGEFVLVSWMDRLEGESYSVKPSVEAFARFRFEDGELQLVE